MLECYADSEITNIVNFDHFDKRVHSKLQFFIEVSCLQ